MIAHEIDDGQLRFVPGDPEPAAQLLQEHHWRLGGSEHDDAVDSRHVDRVMVIEYQDSYVVTDAGWRIAARRLVLLREDVIDLQG